MSDLLLRPEGLPEVFVGSLPGDGLPEPPPTPMETDSVITWRNHLDHWLARWGYKRNGHRVMPGLYALGEPTPKSHVLVTGNYALSFDALRSALAGRDAYILVLDTRGINVWCAAGKGTFGSDELVERIFASGLHQLVEHRRLILPQLGATGVAAHEVKRRAGFRVEYGPVRAADLRQYLQEGQATPEMRRVTFTLFERLILTPIELVHILLPMVIAAAVMILLAGREASLAVVAALLAGAVLFPLLLPWLPTRDFSSKGYILGFLAVLPAALASYRAGPAGVWTTILSPIGLLLGLPSVTAYLALNFTGATPLTSPSMVRREMSRYIPIMALTVVLGALLIVAAAIGRWTGG